MVDLQYILVDYVKPEELHKAVHLDIEKYKKLWTPNDYWRLMTASFNLNLHIDYVYDYVIRFMRNALKMYPDGDLGPTTYKFLSDLAGWPLTANRLFVSRMMTNVDCNYFWLKPMDGFLKPVPANQKVKDYIQSMSDSWVDEFAFYPPNQSLCHGPSIMHPTCRCCYAVRDPERWKYYIENSDPDIGQGQWGDCEVESGPKAFNRGDYTTLLSDEYREVLGLKTTDVTECAPSGEFPDSLVEILKNGIGDTPWRKVLQDWNKTYCSELTAVNLGDSK